MEDLERFRNRVATGALLLAGSVIGWTVCIGTTEAAVRQEVIEEYFDKNGCLARGPYGIKLEFIGPDIDISGVGVPGPTVIAIDPNFLHAADHLSTLHIQYVKSASGDEKLGPADAKTATILKAAGCKVPDGM